MGRRIASVVCALVAVVLFYLFIFPTHADGTGVLGSGLSVGTQSALFAIGALGFASRRGRAVDAGATAELTVR